MKRVLNFMRKPKLAHILVSDLYGSVLLYSLGGVISLELHPVIHYCSIGVIRYDGVLQGIGC